jgi:hypothetical protein
MSGTARPVGETRPSDSDWPTRLGVAVSFAVPFGVAIAHAGTASIWRDDLALLRGLAWVGVGRAGNVSALLAQASYFVPLGSVHFRLAFVAAVVLGAAGVAARALARELLGRQTAVVPLLAPARATIAALAATTSVAALSEGGSPGGGGVALLLALSVLRWSPADAWGRPSRAVPLGMLVGALAAESPWTAFAVLAGLLSARFFEAPLRSPRGAPWALGAAVVTAVLLLSPAWLRPLAKGSFIDGARVLGSFAAPPLTGMGGGIPERFASLGAATVAFSVLGFLYGLWQRALRAGVVAIVVVLPCDVVATLGETKWWPSSDVASLHLLTSAVLAIGIALTVYATATAFFTWRVPMAKGAAILLVVTHLTQAVAAAEEASFALDRSAWRGAEAMTDEIFGDLPPHAALLLRSQGAARRLTAARLAQGTRLDVLVVPIPATGDAHVALRLLREEPALQKALQDIALEGRPGEEALTILADARPVFVELDPGWDRRVYSHFVPDHGWLRFLPEPRGASDRKSAFADLRARSDRVRAASLAGGKPDPETGAMLRARLMDSAIIAALLGDREEASALAARIGEIPGGELFAAELMQKILVSKSGPIDAKGLLH